MQRFTFDKEQLFQTGWDASPVLSEPDRGTAGVSGTVIDALPGGIFRIQLTDGRVIQAHIDRELRLTHIRTLPGDIVTIRLSHFDKSRGRIVRQIA